MASSPTSDKSSDQRTGSGLTKRNTSASAKTGDASGAKRKGAAKPSAAAKSGSSTFTQIVKLICILLILAVCVEVSIYIYIGAELGYASHLGPWDEPGLGNFGMTVARSDELKTTFPNSFARMMQGMNYGAAFVNIFMQTNPHAKEYFESSKALFEKSAGTHKLHQVFARMVVPQPITWAGLIHERIKVMAKAMKEEGRDDFKVEKDRGNMYDFFANNNLPICKVLQKWDNLERFIEDMKSGAIEALALKQPEGEQWPIFVKATHLTQSSSAATMAIKSPEHLQQKIDSGSLASWVKTKWAYRSNDFDRAWVKEGNMLTDSLTPGLLVQAPFVQSKKNKGQNEAWHVEGRFAVGLLEMRVEVLWGRGYLAILDGNIVFLRDGSIEHYGAPFGFLKIPTREKDVHPKIARLRDSGYLDCVWKVAERASAAAAIDAMRVDIFIKLGDPTACTINENSLSSGLPYWGHEEYLTRTWAGPHLSKKYELLNTQKPVYALTHEDTGV